MDARAVNAALRRRERPAPEAVRWFAQGIASGAVSDAQAGAFAMGVCLTGLGTAGRVALTEAMRDSGRVMAWDLPGPVVDKHSSGGIGDCVSLILAPALAACGAHVPMISGRGLGHTGGTLDKLESIPGFSVEADIETLQRLARDPGCAIVAASADLAPADRRLYAIRDVTGTVESIDLITASILSKKLAAGLQALVLDVKCGSGAFMKTPPEAEALATALVETAQGAGCATAALVTDMDQPLIHAAGNALEVIAVMEVLTVSASHPRLHDLTCALGGEALALAGLAATADDGALRIADAIASGRAAERFGAMVAAQGGPADFVHRWRDRLPAAPVQRVVAARAAGHVAAIDGEALGLAVVALGGGRVRGGEAINHAVGLSDLMPLGAEIAIGQPLAVVHATGPAAAEAAAAAVRAAYAIGDPPALPRLVRNRLG